MWRIDIEWLIAHSGRQGSTTKKMGALKTKNHDPWRSAAQVGTAPLEKRVKRMEWDLGGW